MEQKKVRWGILGTAQIGMTQLIPGLLLADNAELYGIAGRKPEKIKVFDEMFHPKKTYLGYDAMLEDPDIDAVYIPLNNALHCEWTVKALNKKKHVLCEKPMACNLKEVLEMQKAADDNGVYVAEAFAYLHSPYVKRLRDIVQGGMIGDLLFMTSWFSIDLLRNDPDNCRFWDEPGAGGVYDLGCYPLSLIRFVTGKDPVRATADGKIGSNNVELTTNTLFQFDGDFYASMFCSMEARQTNGYRIVGTKGQIDGLDYAFNSMGKLPIKAMVEGKDIVEWVNAPHNYMLEVEQLGRCILDGEKPWVDYEFTRKNVDILDNIVKQVFRQNGK